MAVDLKSELTRPLALILAALAMLGWVLFILSSWSAASVQKGQRLQIVQLSEASEKLGADLTAQRATNGELADLKAKVAATRDDLTRISQTRSDVQADLVAAQKSLTSTRRDLAETDRALQNRPRVAEASTPDTTESASAAEPEPTVRGRRVRGGRSVSRGRARRSFYVRRRR